MRGLIVVICFLAGFFLLASLMPSGFMPSPISANNTVTPESNFDAYGFLGWNNSIDILLEPTGNTAFETVRGYQVAIAVDPSNTFIGGYTYASFWVFNWDIDWFLWYYTNGTLLPIDYNHELSIDIVPTIRVSTLDSDYSIGYSMRYEIRNSHTQFNVLFNWNITDNATPSLALIDNGLYLTFETSFDDMGSQINAWTLLSGVLFFQPIAGIPYYLSLLIAFPIWICIAYLMFIFVLRMIGAVFGGGGA